jgi:hypothetical protein
MTLQGWKSISPEATEKEMSGFLRGIMDTLQVGDILVTKNGLETIFLIEKSDPMADVPLYNFIVDGNNSYYANGYLVHNKDQDCWDICAAQCGIDVQCTQICHTECRFNKSQ